MGAKGLSLSYIRLESLVELKLGAARMKDEADVVELIRANLGQVATIRGHLASVHESYVATFDRLVGQATDPNFMR
jgi:hypothetical protein